MDDGALSSKLDPMVSDGYIIVSYILIPLLPAPITPLAPPPPTSPVAEASTSTRKLKKNWENITTEILSAEKEKTLSDDPNAGGDTAVNGFFQQIFAGADEDSKRAMMKSYIESGGTTLSTNWEEVSKDQVEVKPPKGSEYKKWGE